MVDSGLDRESWHWGRFRPPKRSIFVSNGFIWWARVTITCSFTLETPKKIDLTLGRFLVLGFIGVLCFWRLLIGLLRFLRCFLGVLSQKNNLIFSTTSVVGFWNFQMMRHLFFLKETGANDASSAPLNLKKNKGLCVIFSWLGRGLIFSIFDINGYFLYVFFQIIFISLINTPSL
jgi:hypothetical protein